MEADAFALNSLIGNDRRFCLFAPKKYLSKSVSRYFLLFFLIVFASVLSPFSAILLPGYAIVFYKYHLFTVLARQFNLSSRKLWLAAAGWGILLCLPLSVFLKNLIL